MAKSIKRNFIYNVILNISSVIFPLITAPYVSRVLEPDGIGLFNFANTYAGYYSLIALLGIPTYGVREVAKFRHDRMALTKFVSQLLSIATITTFCISFVYIATLFIVDQFEENYIIFLLAGFAIYMSPFSINWYFQGHEEFGNITLRTLLIKLLSVVILFLFVRQKDDLVIYVIINVLGIVLVNIWNYYKMRKGGITPYFTIKGLKPHLKPLFLLFASSIAMSIYTMLDTLMLGFLKSYEEVGFYTTAMHMSKVVLSAVTSLSIVVVPRVSFYMKDSNYTKINSLINKSFSVVSFLAFPTAIGLLCISPTFVPLFFGVKFIGAVLPLMILSVLIIVIGLSNLTGVQVLIGMGFDKLFLYSVLIGTVSNFILNCILIPSYGAVGASFSSVIAESLIFFTTVYFVYSRTVLKIDGWLDVLKTFLGSLSLVVVIVLLNGLVDGWCKVISFIIVGSIVYFVMEVILHNKSIPFFKTLIHSSFGK